MKSKHPGFFEESDPSVSSASGGTTATLSQELPSATDVCGVSETLTEAMTDSAMSLVEHIAELRTRILISVTAAAIAVVVAYLISPELINQLKKLAPSNTLFIQLTMGEALMTTLSMSVYVGLALTAPLILYHVLRFVSPGLHAREQQMLRWALIGGTLLFMAGVMFAYYFVLSPSIDCLLAFGKDIAAPSLSIREFVSFCASLVMVTGLMFELPMVLFLLSFTGLITSAKLIREWRWATVIIFLVAAVVTPTQDPLSLSIVGLAMVGLYVLSIIPIKLCGR